MRHGLCIGCDAVVFLGGERDEFTFEAAEDTFYKLHARLLGSMGNDDERLTFRVDARPMKGVTADDLNIGRQVTLEGFNLWGFGGRLAANNGTHFGAWTVHCYD